MKCPTLARWIGWTACVCVCVCVCILAIPFTPPTRPVDKLLPQTHAIDAGQLGDKIACFKRKFRQIVIIANFHLSQNMSQNDLEFSNLTYDNRCNPHCYILNQEPYFFKTTRFLIGFIGPTMFMSYPFYLEMTCYTTTCLTISFTLGCSAACNISKVSSV